LRGRVSCRRPWACGPETPHAISPVPPTGARPRARTSGSSSTTTTTSSCASSRALQRDELGSSRDSIDETYEVEDDWAVIIPAGVWNNVVNTDSTDLKLYSLDSPPEHPDGTVHRRKTDAEAAEAGR
jgi:hypothetical protein